MSHPNVVGDPIDRRPKPEDRCSFCDKRRDACKAMVSTDPYAAGHRAPLHPAFICEQCVGLALLAMRAPTPNMTVGAYITCDGCATSIIFGHDVEYNQMLSAAMCCEWNVHAGDDGNVHTCPSCSAAVALAANEPGAYDHELDTRDDVGGAP